MPQTARRKKASGNLVFPSTGPLRGREGLGAKPRRHAGCCCCCCCCKIDVVVCSGRLLPTATTTRPLLSSSVYCLPISCSTSQHTLVLSRVFSVLWRFVRLCLFCVSFFLPELLSGSASADTFSDGKKREEGLRTILRNERLSHTPSVRRRDDL